MTKYKILFFSVFFIIFITIVAQQMEIFKQTQFINDGMTSDIEFNLQGIRGFINTYLNLITFKVEGFPIILNVLIFYPINIMAIYFIAEIVKDIIPFT